VEGPNRVKEIIEERVYNQSEHKKIQIEVGEDKFFSSRN